MYAAGGERRLNMVESLKAWRDGLEAVDQAALRLKSESKGADQSKYGKRRISHQLLAYFLSLQVALHLAFASHLIFSLQSG